MVIAKQRANPDSSIAKLASEIVSKWKKVVEVEKAKRQQKAGLSNAGKKVGTSSPASSQAATPAPATPVAATAGYTGDPNTRRYTSDGLAMKPYGEPARDSCAGLIYNGLAFVRGTFAELRKSANTHSRAPENPRTTYFAKLWT